MTVAMTIDYLGDLKSELTHDPSGSVINTDAPTDNGGTGAAFSPTDLVAAALLACAVTTMAIKGAQEGIVLGKTTGRVEKDMIGPPRRIASLSLEIVLPRELTGAQRERLEDIARNCPVALSLAPAIKVEMHFSQLDA